MWKWDTILVYKLWLSNALQCKHCAHRSELAFTSIISLSGKMGQSRTGYISLGLCVASSVVSSLSLFISVHLYQKVLEKNNHLISQKDYCHQSLDNLSLRLEAELQTMFQSIDLIWESVENTREEINGKVKSLYFISSIDIQKMSRLTYSIQPWLKKLKNWTMQIIWLTMLSPA